MRAKRAIVTMMYRYTVREISTKWKAKIIRISEMGIPGYLKVYLPGTQY